MRTECPSSRKDQELKPKLWIPGPSHIPIKVLELPPLGILDSRPPGFQNHELVRIPEPWSFKAQTSPLLGHGILGLSNKFRRGGESGVHASCEAQRGRWTPLRATQG